MANEILIERLGEGIAVLRLNRPEALNTLNRAMTRALRAAIVELEADDSVDVIVLAAAGERAFCAGVDLKERQTLSESEASASRTGEMFPMFRELDGRSKPAVAAAFGHILGGGFELVLACDLIVAAEGSSFGLPEVKWGLIPVGGGCSKLPAMIGPARARELILTAGTLTAEEMLRLGGINRVVPRGHEFDTALALAREIAANKQTAVRGAKRAIDEGVDAWAVGRFDIEISNACYASKERQAAITTFGSQKS